MNVTYQWRVQVSSGQQITVRSGEILEIGRKPLRPLPDDGTPRLEIADSTKSMSKRHARFKVSANGQATLRDLQSTNGSYVVNPDGNLTRLPLDEDFVLPNAALRLQFGDVPIDFTPLAEDEHANETQVANLFPQSAAQSRQEPDAADMSVDEIFDLRAGDPTAIFRATAAANANAAAGAAGTQIAGVQPQPQASSMPQHEAQSQQGGAPRDLFADAMGEQSPSAQSSEAVAAPDAAHAIVAAGEPSKAAGQPNIAEPAHVAEPVQSAKPAQNAGSAQDSKVLAPSEQIAQPAANSRPAADSQVTQPIAIQSVGATQTTAPVVHPVDVTQQSQPIAQPVNPANSANSANPVAYAPAFEPGSVFDKVSRGDFDKPSEPVVEVDGLTSDEARTTTDMSLQFEMARHSELLPFLAMNSTLYDDLYAWLAAQGNRDIDEALANNAGYQSYRKAVGK